VTDENGKRPGLIILMIALVSVFVLIAVIILFPPGGGGDGNGGGSEDTGPWKDMTKFKASLSEVTVFNYYDVNGPGSLDEELDPVDSVYILMGLQDNLTSEDIVSMRDFALKGGKIIVADDATQANRLSEFLSGSAGGKVEFTGKSYLVDSLFTEGPDADKGWVHNVRFVKGYSLVKGSNPHDVLTDMPNGLIVTGEGSPVLTTTKNLTVIDMNDNGEMDVQADNMDIYSPYGPIGVEFNLGEKGGKVTYFSTTGIFTDSMFSEAQNEEFIRSYILSLIPGGGDVKYDDSKQQTPYSPHTTVIPR
jgi:hypothetical protein